MIQHPGHNNSRFRIKIPSSYNLIVWCGEQRMMRTVAHPTETELLLQRLDRLRASKASLTKALDEVTADEQRIAYALEVVRAVVAESKHSLSAPLGAEVGAQAATGALAAYLASPEARIGDKEEGRGKQNLQNVILQLFTARDGLTSNQVAEVAAVVSGAKKESVQSTMSRMCAKELLRRQGRLYFRGAKSEGSEVVATSEPSTATSSGQGQLTSNEPD
jgi:hypothetical protein